MDIILEKKQLIDSKYEIKFFVEGTDYYQKYRSIGKDGNPYLLKLYNSSKLPKESFSKEGLLEAEILNSIESPGIIKLLDSGEIVKESKKYHYLVFNFISGETFQEKLGREGVFSQYAVVPLALDLLDALRALHEHPKVIIHNNINPSSVSLDYSKKSEKPILTNFNCARYISSKSNSVDLKQLSPFYIAPELYNGIFTPQSDIFSVGALLFHLITGIPPWHIELPKHQHTEDKFIDAISENRNKPLIFSANGLDEACDEHLKETIKRALAIDVDNRFSSIDEFSKALRREMVLASGTSKSPPVKKVATKKGGGFSAIAGMQDLKDILYNDVIRALNEKELYESYGVTIPNGMLLYGPPGCGKTFISERFAEEVGLNFYLYTASDFKSKYINETEQKIAAIFKEAADNAPTIICIDEFDTLVPSREGDLHEMHAGAVNEMLAQMSNCSEKGIFIIGAANYPNKMDAAVLRTGRIDRIIYLPPPDYEARASMFEMYLKERPIDLGIDYEVLAGLTENYVSSDIKFIIDEASRFALKSKERITQEILEKSISNSQPSVAFSEIKKYEALKVILENKKESTEPEKRTIGFLHNDGKR